MKVILAVDSIRHPLTGVGRYTFELARHLQMLASPPELLFLRGEQLFESLPVLPEEPAAPPGRAAARGWRSAAVQVPFALGLWRWLHALRMRKVLAPWRHHVLHGPGFYLPAHAGRAVVTVHDLSIFRHPEHHPAGRVRFMRSEIGVALHRAARAIAVSEFGRRELAEVFGWPPERTTVIPLAAGSEFHPREAAELDAFRVHQGLPAQGYALFVGTLEPRKNLSTLLDAYERLPASVRTRWPLVLAGFRGWESTALHGRIARAQQQGWLRYLGFVRAAELPLLFAAARLFVYPSVYEGFGLPVLEAMASGVPVLCARGSSLDEVAGSAAATFPALDAGALHDLLVPALEDESARAGLRARGLAWSAGFSWARCAERTAAVYAQL